ncbi:hypothetical protein HUW63_00645 [Myxococcus sp. AM001]|nr:hypothetical protein [Myxococcus sp. AM001]
MSTDPAPPYWLLISVLFSNQPLSPSLAMTLHQAAFELHQRGEGAKEVAGDMVSGRVVNLRKDVSFGGIAGPAFEAEIETERGSGVVRFVLTRQGLERMKQPAEPPRPKYLN